MPNLLQRSSWTKKAKATLESRRMTDSGRQALHTDRVKLTGPTDGSGCRPAGETVVAVTRWRSNAEKALREAISFCDERQIRITEFPEGLGY